MPHHEAILESSEWNDSEGSTMPKFALGIAIGLILATATVAVASIPDGSGVIHGCRDNKSGALRVIDTDRGQTCRSGETTLTWNQAGPQGPAGIAGYEVVSASGSPVEIAQGLWVAGPVTATCPTGKVPLGGGGQTGTSDVRLAESFPTANGWRATANAPHVSFQLNVYAICASVAG
jgi:hypothetical protein